MRIILVIQLLLFCASPSFAQQRKMGKAELAAIALSPEQISSLIKITDDPLDTKIRLDSSAVYQQRDGLLKIVNGDKYLRAFIDRKTKATLIQVYMFQRHGMGWQHWNRAVATSPEGPIDLEGTRIDGDVNCSRLGCIYTEVVAITVPEALLRWSAKDAQTGVDRTWDFKIYGKSVDGIKTGLMKTEIAGFLQALDRVRPMRAPDENKSINP